MKSFAQPGDVLDLDPGTSVPAGTGHLFGNVFGVAAVDAVGGVRSSFVVAGVTTIAKTSALAIDVGDALYWDPAAKVVNKTAASQAQVGIAIAAAANPSSTVAMLMRGAPVAAGLGDGSGGIPIPADNESPGVLIQSSDGAAGENAGSSISIIAGAAGAGSTAANGGDVNITAGACVGADGQGGNVDITSGADPTGNYDAGAVNITGGEKSGSINITGGIGGGSVLLRGGGPSDSADDGGGSVQCVGGDAATGSGGSIVLQAGAGPTPGYVALQAGSGVIYLTADSLNLGSLDVVATDAAARLTIDGIEYSIAKAVKVTIGADMYHWPLFGGADAGPAPAPAFTDLSDCPGSIVATGAVIGNALGNGLQMTNGITVNAAGKITLSGVETAGNPGSAIEAFAGNATDFDAGALSLGAGSAAGSAGNGGPVAITGGYSTGGAGGSVSIAGGGTEGAGATGGDVSINGGPSYGGGGTSGSIAMTGKSLDINITEALRVNSVPAIAATSFFVAGVGTLTFVQGLLTEVTPP